MFVKDLETLKYPELQKLAKGAGIKANQKIDKLLKALKEYYIEHDEDMQTKQEDNSSAAADTEEQKRGSGSQAMKKSPKNKKMKTSDSEDIAQPAEKVTKGYIGAQHSQVIKQDPHRSMSRNSPQINSPHNRNSNANAVAVKVTPSELSNTTDAAATEQSTSKMQDKTPNNSMNRKRRRTFELDEPTLSAKNTPSSDDQPDKRITRQRASQTRNSSEEAPVAKRVRKDTQHKGSPFVNSSFAGSPGTKAMIDSIDPNLSSAERKAGLMSALDKKVQSRGNKDWAKIHQKEFSKFDSLDVYLEKKQQRIGKLTGSGKKVPALKSPGLKTKIVKPVARPQPLVKPFVPTVTSTKNLSFNFSKTPTSQTTKTPSTQAASKTPKTQNTVASARKSIGIPQRTTPYKFTGNNTSLNTTVNSQKKTFDLKASLAKPLTWKPHTGKLLPLDFNKPLPSSAQKPSIQQAQVSRLSRKAMASKSRPLQAKDVRRAKQLDRRNNQKYIDMMKRRGLMA